MAKNAPSAVFAGAVQASSLTLKKGLSAVKKREGRDRIDAANTRCMLGSVCVDDDCRAAHPQASRWDYALGYTRAERVLVYFVEVHSADASGVSELKKKFGWLKDYLAQPTQAALNGLSREFHWVASGRIQIPKTTPQHRYLNTTLRKEGLLGPTKHLTLL